MTDLQTLRQEAITKGWEAYHEADPYSVSEVEAAMVATFEAGVAAGREAAALADFTVSAGYDREIYLAHVLDRRICWDAEVESDVSLSRLVELASQHIADQHGHGASRPS